MLSQEKIQSIYELAINDETFLRNFLENSELVRGQIELTDSEIEEINSLFNSNINGKEFIRYSLGTIKDKVIPIPKPWLPSFIEYYNEHKLSPL